MLSFLNVLSLGLDDNLSHTCLVLEVCLYHEARLQLAHCQLQVDLGTPLPKAELSQTLEYSKQ